MLQAENVGVQIEVEGAGEILLVTDRKTEAILVPWQDAFLLAETLHMAVNDVRNETDVIDMPQVVRDQAQVRLGTVKGMVSIVFPDFTDRVRFRSWRSAALVADALKVKAQDAQYAERNIRLPTFTPHGLQFPGMVLK